MVRTDHRIGGCPRLYLVDPKWPLMRVPDEIRKSVVFLGYRHPDHGDKLSGTAFLVGVEEDGYPSEYLVTAAHVIQGVGEKGVDKVFVRANEQFGAARQIDTNISQWHFHPDSVPDVAVLPWPSETDPELDLMWYPMTSAVTTADFDRLGIGVGDEVFMAGLYQKHAGKTKIAPIIRVGNLAAIPEERVETDRGLMEAYLVETRSIAGISGSPVFVHLAPFTMGGALAPGRNTFYLLGLMHGRWDIKHLAPIEFEVDTKSIDRPFNSGISVVVPASRILDVLARPELVARRNQLAAEKAKENETSTE